jgi:hypothetical protein
MGAGTLSGSGIVMGGMYLTPQSHLAFQTGGTQQGLTYDSIAFAGINLGGGELDISFTNGFQNLITPDEQFIVATGVGGTLGNVADGGRLLTTDGYGSFQVNYDLGDLVLSDFQPVPEPASFGLLIAGSALLTRRGYPRKRCSSL